MARLYLTILFCISIIAVTRSVTIQKGDVSSVCLHRGYGYGLTPYHADKTYGHCQIMELPATNQKTDQCSVKQENHDRNGLANDQCDMLDHLDDNERTRRNYFTYNIRLNDQNGVNNYTSTFNDQTVDEDNGDNMGAYSKINPDNWNIERYFNDMPQAKEQLGEHALDEQSESQTNRKYIFTPNIDSQMLSFKYVCIEYDQELNENKVVIYRSEMDDVLHLPKYKLTFTTGDIPHTHTFISEYPAYFVVFEGTTSFYHHYEDVVVPAYDLLKYTGRLNSSVKSQLYFYHNGLYEGFDQFYTHAFLMELPIRSDYFALDKTKPNICYLDAAFSLGGHWHDGEPPNFNVPKVIARLEVTHFLKQTLRLGEKCSYMNHIVLLNRRSQRIILNSLELLLAAIEIGFSSINIIDFEDLNLLEQAEVMSCARIYILVHGSGMIWIPFMPPNSAVIEIAWPQKNWVFFASDMFAIHPHLHIFKLQLPTKDLYPDMGHLLKITSLEDQTKKHFEKSFHEWPENPHLGNPYKFAHCLVDKQAFLEVLKQADQRLKGN